MKHDLSSLSPQLPTYPLTISPFRFNVLKKYLLNPVNAAHVCTGMRLSTGVWGAAPLCYLKEPY